MILLIDTAILIWTLADSPSLTVNSRKIIEQAAVRLVSSISIAEIEVKRSIGKLRMPDVYVEQIVKSGFDELPFDFKDAFELRSLPLHHRDPFDRMLISQARARGLTILTSNVSFKEYNVPVVMNE